MTTSTTTESGNISRRYYAAGLFYTIEDLIDAVAVMTDTIIWNYGDLSNALWVVSDKFLDYGKYQLIVSFDLKS